MTPRDGLVVRANCTMTTTTGGTGAETRVWSQHPGHGRRPGNVCASVPVSRAHPRSASTAAVLRPQLARPPIVPGSPLATVGCPRLRGMQGSPVWAPHPISTGRRRLPRLGGRWWSTCRDDGCVPAQQAWAAAASRSSRPGRNRRTGDMRGDDGLSGGGGHPWMTRKAARQTPREPCCRPSIRRCSSSRSGTETSDVEGVGSAGNAVEDSEADATVSQVTVHRRGYGARTGAAD